VLGEENVREPFSKPVWRDEFSFMPPLLCFTNLYVPFVPSFSFKHPFYFFLLVPPFPDLSTSAK
jgi:hypothetical protein